MHPIHVQCVPEKQLFKQINCFSCCKPVSILRAPTGTKEEGKACAHRGVRIPAKDVPGKEASFIQWRDT